MLQLRLLGAGIVIAVLAIAAVPETSAARVLCVASASARACDRSFNEVQKALDAAALEPGADEVRVGKGVFPGPFCYLEPDGLQITGEGPGTVLTLATERQPCAFGLDAVLTFALLSDVAGDIEVVQDLTVVPKAGTIGIVQFNTRARHVDVVSGEAGTEGAVLLGGAAFSDGKVLLPDEAGSGTAGVFIGGAASVTDTFVNAADGVSVEMAAPATPEQRELARLLRLRVVARCGVVTTGGEARLQSSLVRLLPGGTCLGTFPPTGLLSVALTGASAEIDARNVTVAGVDAAGPSLPCNAQSTAFEDWGVVAFATGGGVSSVRLNSSIVAGVDCALVRLSGEGAARISTAYSNYPGSVFNPDDVDVTESDHNSADPLFEDASAADFRLAEASPLIDRGDPNGLAQGESPLDLDSAPRILAGGHHDDCAARRDIGALEFVSDRLVAKATVTPGTGTTGSPILFDASTSCDPDPAATLSYEWSFDDGGSAHGAAVLHAFGTPGNHVARLTVSDRDGRTGATTAMVSIDDAAQPQTAPPPTASSGVPVTDKTAPNLTKLELRPRVFTRRVGTTVRYTVSEPAIVHFRLERFVRGRLVKGRCVRSPAGIRRHKRCTRTVSLAGSVEHAAKRGSNKLVFSGRFGEIALSRGRYRLIAVATDESGNRGPSSTARFRVVL